MSTTGLSSLQQSTGIPATNLLKVLNLEVAFHTQILNEPDSHRRLALYSELYSAVHPLLSSEAANTDACKQIVRLFAHEFQNRSVLDIGCGEGSLLRAIAAHSSPSFLIGIDIYPFPSSFNEPFTFLQEDIVSFTVDRPVEVVVSSQVIEHIAPADLDVHLDSVHHALVTGGQFIVMTPNRLWGPHDITRVYDCTYTNRVAAMGSHLNELTYRELIPLLRKHGFRDIRTIVPFAGRLPLFGSLRIRPVLNLLIEGHRAPRNITYLLKRRGRAMFKNPIVLVARKA